MSCFCTFMEDVVYISVPICMSYKYSSHVTIVDTKCINLWLSYVASAKVCSEPKCYIVNNSMLFLNLLQQICYWIVTLLFSPPRFFVFLIKFFFSICLCNYRLSCFFWVIIRNHSRIGNLHIEGLPSCWQGHKEWVTEVNFLGVVEHPNLVKLVGYCAEDDERGIQRLLVYEFLPHGSVEDHLSNRAETPLSWAMRLRIAQDAARGLTYLHEELDVQVLCWYFFPVHSAFPRISVRVFLFTQELCR